MNRSQTLILIIFFLCAVIARTCSLPERPFFCDVPASVAAVETGAMRIQFPGYVPFHLAIKAFGSIFGGAFAGAVFFSLLCGMGAVLYCALFAYERAGFPGALLALAVMGFSPIAIYFSCVGASYTTDLLGMSALIYHGNRVLTKRSGRDYKYAVLWFVFGCLMRSLSFPFVGLGLLYLLWKCPTRNHIVFTAVVFTLGGFLYSAVTFFYFGALNAIIASVGPAKGAGLHPVTVAWMAGNEVRNILFTGWSLNIFIFIVLAFLWFARKQLNGTLCVFFILLTLPYFCFLLWYICHAGYICLLLPAFICAPWLAEERFWLDSRAISLAAIFGIISFLQFFVARPIPFTGPVSLVLNSYILTYTYQGIKQGMFDNLQNWASKTHLGGEHTESGKRF